MTDCVYQSGERVQCDGTYAVVGVESLRPSAKRELALRDFRAGEQFPAYDGLEVAWRLVRVAREDSTCLPDTPDAKA